MDIMLNVLAAIIRFQLRPVGVRLKQQEKGQSARIYQETLFAIVTESGDQLRVTPCDGRNDVSQQRLEDELRQGRQQPCETACAIIAQPLVAG
jgi:hypothetical protein